MKSKEKFIHKHSLLFRSIAIFMSWLMFVYACPLFILSLFLCFISNFVLGISLLLSSAGLFILGIFTIKEKEWNYFGWVALMISLLILPFTILNGLSLINLVIVVGVISVFSYLGFAYKKRPSKSAYIFGFITLVVFVFHSVILSTPRTFGLNVRGDELAIYYSSMINKAATMDPLEFIKIDSGKKLAIQIYNSSPFISQEELNNIVKANPEPLIEAQQSLVSKSYQFDNNPYGSIINIYLYSFINLIKK